MDSNNWRPNQGNNPTMDTNDWRAQLPPDSRQRIVNKIMDILKKHLPVSGPDGLHELRKIAKRFEEKIFTAATSQPDYLRKISMKMLAMETKSQNTMANNMPPNQVGPSNNPTDQDTMLGKDLMARLRSIVKCHKLAAGSQTVPNSVAEAAVARGELPPVGSSSPIAPPAPVRKKLPPKRAKRKNPIMVSDEEDDESTEDGLICKRNRATITELPANESTGPDYAENPPSVSTPFESAGDALPSNTSAAGGVLEQTADIQWSPPQPVVEPDVSPPRPDVPLVVHTYEGGDENQPPTPLPIPALPFPVEEVLKAHAAHLSAMTTECVEKRLYQMMGEALRDSLSQYESEASVAKDQVQQLKRDLTMRGLEFSRLENALKEELRSERKNSAELNQKLNAKLLKVTELEGKLVHQQEKIADLEETLKAKGVYAGELEAKSIEREDLLGKIKADMDQKAKELSEKDKELSESAAKLAQALEENEKLKKQSEELDLGAANVLTSGFGAALE